MHVAVKSLVKGQVGGRQRPGEFVAVAMVLIDRCAQRPNLREKLTGLIGAPLLQVDDRRVGVALGGRSRLGALHELEQPVILAVDPGAQRDQLTLHAEQLLRIPHRAIVEVSIEFDGTSPEPVDVMLSRGQVGVGRPALTIQPTGLAPTTF